MSVPAAPTGLTATAGEDAEGTVTLSWTAPTGGGAVSGYEYQQKAGTGAYGAWTPHPRQRSVHHVATSSPGLTNGTAYAFRVRAVNSTGAGAASTEATATPTTGRLVWAKSEQEVAAEIARAMAAGSGDDMTFDAGEQIEILGSALFNAAPGVTLSYDGCVEQQRRSVRGHHRDRHGDGDGESGRNGGYHHHRHGQPAVRLDDRPSDGSARGEHHVPGRGGHRGAHARARRDPRT